MILWQKKEVEYLVPQTVFCVDVILVAPGEEVLHKTRIARKALQSRIHVARIAQVT